MVGGTWVDTPNPIPEKAVSWLSKKSWCTICEFSQNLPVFKKFDKDFI